MSEIDKLVTLFSQNSDAAPVGYTLAYGRPIPELGYTVVRRGDPCGEVKQFLYGVLCYMAMNCDQVVNLQKIKNEIFG